MSGMQGFYNVFTMLIVVVNKIKREAVVWSMAGAKHVGSIVLRKELF
jgi:hypothetical protein